MTFSIELLGEQSYRGEDSGAWSDFQEMGSEEELYLELFHPLLRLARSRGVPRDEAEAIVHDAFMSYLRLGDHVETPEAYLMITVRNLCASWWRRQKRMTGDALAEASATPDYDRQLAVVSVWPRLSSRDRHVLRLRFSESLKIRQIAARLGISQTRAGKILRRAIERASALVDESERCGVGGFLLRTDTYPAYRGRRRIIRAHVCRLRGAALPRTPPHPAVLSAHGGPARKVSGQLSGAHGLLQASGGAA
jgi:RNA polymerase sigma factor (sigma-70 family)